MTVKNRERGGGGTKMRKLVMLGCAATLSSCTAIPDQTQTAAKCPPPGTEVPFAKIMTTSLVADYQGCNVVTTAEFVATGTGSWLLGV